jgi:indolepyruvate ferredoxin oxidoreductase
MRSIPPNSRAASLAMPHTHLDNAPYDILVTGVGGTGVVTVGALISMAAHLEGKSASVLDFMGFAQKGGSVLSFVRFAATDALLNQVRIDTQQADLLLACDMVVGASPEALQTVRHDRTKIVVNTHAIPNASFVQNPEANLHADALLDKMRHAAGIDAANAMRHCDAQALAQRFLGDTIGANILMLGFAWQLGLVPVSHAALMRALELNNVAVASNKLAFAIGRLAAEDMNALESLTAQVVAKHVTQAEMSLDELIRDRETRLLAYGGQKVVTRYRALLAKAASNDEIKRALAITFYKLLAVKDEYEVARLYTDPSFRAALAAQFEGNDYTVKFNLAPPTLSRNGDAPKKKTFGQWMWPVLGGLAKFRALRGTVIDPFGRTLERRMERQLADDFEVTISRALSSMNADNAAQVTSLAALFERVRGYGHVKLANVAMVKRSERDIAARIGIEAATGDAVRAAIGTMKGAASLKWIPVVVAK